ncbi:MAG: adenylosuccinate lyase [Candidatus Omnitrophica bacterium]|nr:adenylosuccinate lyase [Candidatus Omnitrophota bacterium]
MIERYTPPEIGALWSDEEKFQRFLRIEKYFLEAQEAQGQVPRGVSREFDRVTLSVSQIRKLEEKTHHDIVAFLQHISPQLEKAAPFLHRGMTSSDLLDTTLAWQLRDAARIILQELDRVIEAAAAQARRYKDTLCIARTHGVHADMYCFGLKFAYVYSDLKRERRLLEESLEYVAQGKISGAVGTFAYFGPEIEEYICGKIGIGFAPVSTQIVSRERFAYFLSILALIGATLERFATEIRHLQRNEVAEAKEPFYRGQKGSSAMPHKQNPISCERLCGLSRLLRGNMLTAYENINLWHERDISHSSAERVILPDATITVVYMLKLASRIMNDLHVDSKKMMKNIELNRGLIFSQKLLLLLMGKGVGRMEAYDIVQEISLRVINESSTFQAEVKKDARVAELVSESERDEIFDSFSYLTNVDNIYARVGLT